ncbi:MAG: serine/threonine-protein kinase [Candidatus Brocadiia bacterium]
MQKKINTPETAYEIVRCIARGGMAVVYEARQLGVEGFAKTVAIKMILENICKDPEFKEMFVGEAKLVADLVHQNIAQIYQLVDYGGSYFMVMEFLSGKTVDEFNSRHKQLGWKVPQDLAVFVASRVCRGLEYAHRKRDRSGHLLGIVHRDVTPKNIIITSEGEVKLTDFGIAKAKYFMKDEEGEVLMGKAEYMSPEQARYQQTDHRSDLFSLGIVLYEILTGVNIFDTSTDVHVVLKNVCEAEIPDPRRFSPDLSSDLVKILMKALQRDREKRYQSATEMVFDLEYFMYHDRYGPTIMSLSKYMSKLFPESDPENPFSDLFNANGPTTKESYTDNLFPKEGQNG